MKKQIIIVWFRKDLRTIDHPALYHASKDGSIIPIFILDQKGAGSQLLGQRSAWWLEQSLQALNKDLKGKLLCYRAESLSIIKKIIKKSGATALYWNSSYDPLYKKQEEKILNYCKKMDIITKQFQASVLWEPSQIHKDDGSSYQRYSPFYNACIKKPVRAPYKKPQKISFAPHPHSKEEKTITDLKLVKKNFLQKDLETIWQPGQKEAIKKLDLFIKHDLKNYQRDRNYPARSNTSHVSPYLTWGNISPHHVWWQIKHKGPDYASKQNIQSFLLELVWREFCYHVLSAHPDMQKKNLQPKFDHMKWLKKHKHIKAWQNGMTGYPLVDAGMRELLKTGYMHNRVRMIVGSFLVKNLHIDWRVGQAWFWNLLVDADVANNSFNWQWVAGSGYDSAQYVRIFNPILQAKRWDKTGEYIKKWIPELKSLPEKYLYQPGKAPKKFLTLIPTYPKEIIDLATSSKRAIEYYKKL